MISSKHISIILQGPIYEDKLSKNNTFSVIGSYRQNFPNAEIILSTWEGDKDILSMLDPQLKIKIVLSKDPGTDHCGDAKFNLNRQIRSTKEGLKYASREYVLKTRTDAKIDSKLFLFWHNLHLKTVKHGNYFQEPLTIYSLSTRNWDKGFIPHLLHPCDWFFFGRKEDLQKLFIGDLIVPEELNYFDGKIAPRRKSFSGYSRYTPEQWILVSSLLTTGTIKISDFSNFSDKNKKIKGLNFDLFKQDFLVLDQDQLGIISWKYPFPHSSEIQISQLRHVEWVYLTKQSHLPFSKLSPFRQLTEIKRLKLISMIGYFHYLLGQFKVSLRRIKGGSLG